MTIDYSGDVALALPWLEQFFSLEEIASLADSPFFQSACGQIVFSLDAIASHQEIIADRKQAIVKQIRRLPCRHQRSLWTTTASRRMDGRRTK
jgi:hypothetical protein